MAEIRPFRAWRYHSKHTHRIDSLVSPLFDVISEKQRKQLYAEPLNSMHLSVPLGENSALRAKQKLSEWKNNGDIVQDPEPSIYVYYQYFCLPNDPVKRVRKGFVCFIKAYDYKEGIVLRHENTIPHSVNDRIELLEQTHLNVSPTHGLYTDKDFELEPYMDAAMESPIYEIEDYQGVTDAFAIIRHPEVIRFFQEKLANQKIILADGHHRYAGSLQYRKQMMQKLDDGEALYNYHMIYLTNTEADDLRILPTHRLIKDLPRFDVSQLLKDITRFFYVKEVEDTSAINEFIMGKKWCYGVLLAEKAFVIKLREEQFKDLQWQFPEKIKALDLTVLHYFFIEKVLGIPGKYQRSSQHIDFERNLLACYQKVNSGRADMALITNEVHIDQVKEVCYSGYTLPQKSTYFYPKVVCGFLFGSISPEDA